MTTGHFLNQWQPDISEVNATEHLWWQAIIGSDNGLLPQTITIVNIVQGLCRHMASLGHNESTVLSNEDTPHRTVMNKLWLQRWQICAPHPSHWTHWGRVTHIYISKLTIIASDNGLSPGQRQAIIWTNAGILLIGPLGTNFSENFIGIQTFSFKKMHLKMSSAKWRPFFSASMC